MSRKLYLFLFITLVTVNAASAGVADQNERLKALIERAKARKAGELSPAPTSIPASVTPTTPVIKTPVTPVTPAPTVQAPATPAATAPVPVSPVRAPVAPSAPSTNTNERKPRILETHPKTQAEPVKEIVPVTQPQAPSVPVFEEKVIIKEKTVREAPVRVRETTAGPVTTTIEKKTNVVQPAVQTLITPVTSIPIQTKNAIQSTILKTPAVINTNTKNYVDVLKSIDSVQSKPGTPIQKPATETVQSKSIIQEQVTTEAAVENQTEFKAQPNAGGSNYNDVLNSIDAILKGQQAEEKASQKSKSKAPELEAKPISKKDERKAESSAKETPKTKSEINADKNSPLINEGVTPKNTFDKVANGQTASAGDKDADYLLVLRKSLKSLEEDSWANVKLNMGEALDYFAKEKKLYPNNPKLNTYYKVILGFQRFSEGGLELDEGDFADFEDAEALYLDTQDLLEESKKELGKDYTGEQVRTIVDTVLKYTEEELEYIEEMLGM